VAQASTLPARLFEKSFSRSHDPHHHRFTISWLDRMIVVLSSYHEDIQWVAAHAAYLDQYSPTSARSLPLSSIRMATTVMQFSTSCLASARGDHEIGAMGRM